MAAGGIVRRLFLVLTALSVILLLTARHGAADNGPVEGFLPTPGFSEGWVMSGKVNRYNPENLYVYIDGEAELFMPYGFEELVSAFYTKGNDGSSGIVADIYRMRSLIDAFGIYSNYRDAGAEAVNVGAGGFIDDTQLMFHKDRYFVRLSVSGTVPKGRVMLERCALAIDGHLPGGSSRPGELDMLDVPGVVPGTVRYVARSVLGYVFFEKGLTADITVNGETAKAFIIIGRSPEVSSAAFGKYIDYLKGSGVPVQPVTGEKGTTLTVQDPLYRGTIVRRSGAYIYGVTRLKDPLKGEAVIDRMQSRVKAR
jgi:hypothetical protein